MRIGYGIDFENAAVVRAVRRRGRMAFRTRCAGGDLAAAASEALRAFASGRAGLAAALPTDQAVLRRLSAPFASTRKSARVLPALLEAGLPFPLERCVTCLVDVESVDRERVEAVGMAALRERVEARVAALREAGLDAGCLEHTGRALWAQGLIEAPPASAGERRLVAFATAERLDLAMGNGTRLEAAVAVGRGSVGLAAARRWVQAAWASGPETPARMLWAGPAAASEEAASLVEALAPGGALVPEPVSEPETFLARAIAARALADEDGGFLQGDMMHPVAVRLAGKRMRSRAIRVMAAGLALSAASLGWAAWLERVEAREQETLTRRALEITGAPVPLGFEVQRVREHAARRAEDAAPLAALFRPSLTEPLADVLGMARREGIEIGALRLSDGEIHVEGRAPDGPRVERLASRLRAAGYRLHMDRGEPDADARVPFVAEGERP